MRTGPPSTDPHQQHDQQPESDPPGTGAQHDVRWRGLWNLGFAAVFALAMTVVWLIVEDVPREATTLPHFLAMWIVFTGLLTFMAQMGDRSVSRKSRKRPRRRN